MIPGFGRTGFGRYNLPRSISPYDMYLSYTPVMGSPTIGFFLLQGVLFPSSPDRPLRVRWALSTCPQLRLVAWRNPRCFFKGKPWRNGDFNGDLIGFKHWTLRFSIMVTMGWNPSGSSRNFLKEVGLGYNLLSFGGWFVSSQCLDREWSLNFNWGLSIKHWDSIFFLIWWWFNGDLLMT